MHLKVIENLNTSYERPLLVNSLQITIANARLDSKVLAEWWFNLLAERLEDL